MSDGIYRHRISCITCALIGAFVPTLWLLPMRSALAVTPESPEVVEVINRGIAFLESAPIDTRLGGKCLGGLCMLKSGKETSHPAIAAALESCRTTAKSPDGQDNYSTGLAIIFLCELDASQHQELIQAYLTSLLKRQKPNGGWGYPGSTVGDTSQVQYATLGLWTAQASGLEVPQAAVERLCAYLMRTQDPSGAWGYQAVDPGGYNRVAQNPIRPSLVAAGLGSLYICGDMLEMNDRQQPKPEPGVPTALRVVESKADAAKRKGKSKTIDETMWRRFAADGNTWFDRHFTVKTAEYNHYYLYAYERYASYRELAEGRFEREPEWYQQVFDYLQSTQKANGSWTGQDNDYIATTFAILCLIRSSKKSIQKIKVLGEGSLLGGMGLPAETTDLQEKDGKVIESKLAGSVDELLAIIEDPKNSQLGVLAAGGALALDSDVTKRSGQIARLRALVSAGSFESRLIAVKALAKSRDLDNVPILLFALTDPIDPKNPDYRIVKEADKGLRFISRKFAGVGMPEEPMPHHAKEAQKAWKEWFLSIRPDAELID